LHEVPFVILVAADDASTPTKSEPKRMLVTTAALAFFIINHSLFAPFISTTWWLNICAGYRTSLTLGEIGQKLANKWGE
jgi:hypothetical protein